MREKLTLENLCGGAVKEKIHRGMARIIDNILDPNISATSKRTLTIKLSFTPGSEDREDVVVDAGVTISLAPEDVARTMVYVSKDLSSGHVTMQEHRRDEIKGQITLDDLGIELQQAPTAEELGCDPDTGEILEQADQKPSKVLEFNKAI